MQFFGCLVWFVGAFQTKYFWVLFYVFCRINEKTDIKVIINKYTNLWSILIQGINFYVYDIMACDQFRSIQSILFTTFLLKTIDITV